MTASTIRDVAREANVSVATVSRALRGLDRVHPQTRARIVRLAAEMDFVASPTAASLASGRTGAVAVVAPFRNRWYFATLVSAIDRSLRQHDRHVLLVDLEGDTYDRRRRLTHSMLRKRVDGVITLNIPVNEAELDVIDRLDLPLVAVGTPVPGRSVVRVDDFLTMRTATEHLIALGHRRIAYVGPVPDHVAHTETPLQRLNSFEATLADHALRAPAAFIVDAEWTAVSAARAVSPILRATNRPTAVVAASDEMAIGVVQAARRLGLNVPNELSVIGIDDHELSEVMDLTTMRQDLRMQGRWAAEMLVQRLKDPTTPSATLTVPTELVIRGTTQALEPQPRPERLHPAHAPRRPITAQTPASAR
jgi:DNA-binding LacI/PurR family transcriptional regulator